MPVAGLSPAGSSSGMVIRNLSGGPVWGYPPALSSGGHFVSFGTNGALTASGGILPTVSNVAAGLTVTVESYSSPSKLLIKIANGASVINAATRLFTVVYSAAFTNFPILLSSFQNISGDLIGPAPLFVGPSGTQEVGVFNFNSGDKTTFDCFCAAGIPTSGSFHIGVWVVGD